MVNKWNMTHDSIKNRNIRIAVRGRAKYKIGEEGELACEKLQKNLSYLTTPHRDPIRKEAKHYNKQRMHHLIIWQKNRHAQDDMHGMATMMQ
jgi:hypothetical protein